MRIHTTRPGRPRFLAALIAILGVAVIGSTLAIAQGRGEYRFFDPLIEVKNIISHYAVEDPDEDALQRAAINGMIAALDDPYAVYVPPQFREEFEKELTGEYVGIGAEVNMVEGVFTIVTPMDDSPAFRAGVMAGDRIRAIDGEPTQGLSVDECIDRLMGEDGTPVVISVEREAGQTTDITIIRAPIKSRAIRGFRRHADDDATWDYLLDAERRIGYIRVSQFTPSVAAEFRDALTELGAPDARLAGLVIDVRWNPGGLLDQAIRMADLLIEEGVIVSTKGRAYPEQTARATAPGTLPHFPVAILINGQSASASEVLAGALVENGRAIAVGERSFGKGSVQSVHPLGGAATGASLKLTEQRYYLPSGRSLHRADDSEVWGVDPSPGYFVPVEDDELLELMRLRRESEILTRRQADEPQPHADPSWILENLKDRQLAEAVAAIRAHIETGAFPANDSAPASADAASLREQDRLMRARERLLRELSRVDRRIDALAAGVTTEKPAWDLWPDDAQIQGGRLILQGPDGATIATLRINSPDLERWLIDAGVAPE